MSFETTALVLGAALVAGAILSGLAKRSFLSLTALFVLVGFVLGEGGLEVIDFDPGSGFVHDLAIVALIVILFRDGIEVEEEMLQDAWHLPLRKLVLAMPITCVLIAVAAHVLVDLDWTAAFLVGALLSPTDPVLSSAVITNERVPRLVRHSLNLESGLNDGLALPAVLAFAAALGHDDDFVWWEFVLRDITVGLLFGLAMGWLAARALPRARRMTQDRPTHAESTYALGVAFATYGVTVALPLHGNGFIAVFVAGVVFGIQRQEVAESFQRQAEDIAELVKLGVFVVFGALLTVDGLFANGVAAVALVLFVLLVARPVAIFVALAGSGTDRSWVAFMAWFGPKGVATMAFSIFVLGQDLEPGTEIFNLAALCVFVSIFAHGLTDTPGAHWLGRREARAGRAAS